MGLSKRMYSYFLPRVISTGANFLKAGTLFCIPGTRYGVGAQPME